MISQCGDVSRIRCLTEKYSKRDSLPFPMTAPLAGRPTFAAIDAAALRANFTAVRALLPANVAVMAVVKANAYGHGAALVAPIFEAAGADYLGVVTIEEGVELRAAGVRKPILVLTGARAGDVAACHEHQLSVGLLHRDMVRELAGSQNSAPLRVHIKVDTGMGRVGVLPDDLLALLDDVRRAGHFQIDGIYSHFASADSVDREYSDYQLRVFRQAVETLAAGW